MDDWATDVDCDCVGFFKFGRRRFLGAAGAEPVDFREIFLGATVASLETGCSATTIIASSFGAQFINSICCNSACFALLKNHFQFKISKIENCSHRILAFTFVQQSLHLSSIGTPVQLESISL